MGNAESRGAGLLLEEAHRRLGDGEDILRRCPWDRKHRPAGRLLVTEMASALQLVDPRRSDLAQPAWRLIHALSGSPSSPARSPCCRCRCCRHRRQPILGMITAAHLST